MDTEIIPGTTDDTRWKEALPYLDDSLAALPAEDRDVVLLRFYEGRTFREIGEVIGKTESAGRKITLRAVEKLERLLVKRGSVLPAAAIAAGMASGYAEAAPAGVAARIASGASAAPGKLAAFTPLIVFRLALVASIAGLGAAFMIDRREPNEVGELVLADLEPAPSTKGIVSAIRPDRRDPATMTVASLLEAVVNADFAKQDGGGKPQGDLFAPEPIDLIQLEIMKLPEADVRAHLKELANHPAEGQAKWWIEQILLFRLSEFDPARATELAVKGNLLHGTGYALQLWAKADPAAAHAWMQEHASNPEFFPNLAPRPENEAIPRFGTPHPPSHFGVQHETLSEPGEKGRTFTLPEYLWAHLFAGATISGEAETVAALISKANGGVADAAAVAVWNGLHLAEVTPGQAAKIIGGFPSPKVAAELANDYIKERRADREAFLAGLPEQVRRLVAEEGSAE